MLDTMEDGDLECGEFGGAAARTPSPTCGRDRDGTPEKQTPPSCAAVGAADCQDKSVEKAASPESLAVRIEKLKAEQAALIEQKKKTSKDLKNAERKRRRLKQKARTLSDDDLVQLLQLRNAAPAEASGEASAAASKRPKRSEAKGN